MTNAAAATRLAIRPYRDEDEPRVLDLLRATLGGGPGGSRTEDFFRWKHLDNPFGRSFMLVAESDGELVGLRAFLRWRFRAGDRDVRAVRAVDTATHPDHQGRGIFRTLTLEALEALRGDVDVVFNTPNPQSMAGYLKMGWRTVGDVPFSIRPLRPVRFLRGVRSIRGADEPAGRRPDVSAEPAGAALGDAGEIDALLAEVGAGSGFHTARDAAFLAWRFGAAPSLDYRAVREERGGRLRGLAVFRVRPRGRLWESTVADVIAPGGDRRVAGRLLRSVARAARVDHVTCRFGGGSAASTAARRWGAVRSPRGITLVVNPLRDGIAPDPGVLGSWAGLSLGDLEVF
jgi:GNAT superfamily N-acetyltransferase